MEKEKQPRDFILLVIAFMLGVGVQLIIGIISKKEVELDYVNSGVKYWERGWTDCYDQFDSIIKVANDKEKEPVVLLDMVGRDTVRVTLYRKQKYRVKK